MAEITQEQISATYDLAKLMHDEGLPESDALRHLVRDHGMGRSSANDHLGAHRHMMRGEVYRRSISQAAVGYFLRSIRADRGEGAAALALASVDAHIEYYESVRPVRRRGMRIIADEFRSLLDSGLTADLVADEFARKVAASLKLSASDRQGRLPPDGTKPATAIVSAKVYLRNADVAAETLMRAAGCCEQCGSSAPFLRKSDGRPYLEVHHKIRLADGGDDTVSNTLALCPNCHRRRHYG